MRKVNWPAVFEYEELEQRPWDGISSSEEWHRYQYAFLKQYCSKTLEGWSVLHCFEDVKAEEIGIYAATDFAEIALLDLKRYTDREIVIADNSEKKQGTIIHGMKVLSKEELVRLYFTQDIKRVLVCSFFSVNEIMKDLMDSGIELEHLRTITSALIY